VTGGKNLRSTETKRSIFEEELHDRTPRGILKRGGSRGSDGMSSAPWIRPYAWKGVGGTVEGGNARNTKKRDVAGGKPRTRSASGQEEENCKVGRSSVTWKEDRPIADPWRSSQNRGKSEGVLRIEKSPETLALKAATLQKKKKRQMGRKRRRA